jgi:hypothetical protein
MEIVEKIAAVPVDMEDRPLKDVQIVECGFISKFGDAVDAAGNQVDKEEEGQEAQTKEKTVEEKDEEKGE